MMPVASITAAPGRPNAVAAVALAVVRVVWLDVPVVSVTCTCGAAMVSTGRGPARGVAVRVRYRCTECKRVGWYDVLEPTAPPPDPHAEANEWYEAHREMLRDLAYRPVDADGVLDLARDEFDELAAAPFNAGHDVPIEQWRVFSHPVRIVDTTD